MAFCVLALLLALLDTRMLRVLLDERHAIQ